MQKEDWQKNLFYITKMRVTSLESKKIKAARAIWAEDTAYITIYFDEKPSEDDLEEASIICTEIIAEMPSYSFLNEEFIFLKDSDKIPSDHIAFERN